MTIKRVFALFAIASIINFGCSQGPVASSNPSTETTTIYGRIGNESGTSIAGVSVSSGLQSTTTDDDGFFILKDVTVPKGRAMIIAKKIGYFNAARAAIPSADGTTRMTLSMMSDAATNSVSAISGGTVNVSGGASIKFTAGSFTDVSGNTYSGTVSITAHYLNPSDTSFFNYFSGDNYGQTQDNRRASLISCGVLRVELKDQNGNSLQLDTSKPATLFYPKPLDMKAPTSMPLWYFDESLGFWKEEGTATLNNGFYSGTVKHFSDWNCDYSYIDSSGSISLRVVCNGAPVHGVAVSIYEDDGLGKYFITQDVVTRSDGTVFIGVPPNRSILVDIRGDHNNGFFFINTAVSAFLAARQTINLGDITLNSSCPGKVTGIVKCNNNGVEGLVSLSGGKYSDYFYAKSKFSFDAPSGIPLTLMATDPNGNLAIPLAIATLFSSEQRDAGEISLCGNAPSWYLDIPCREGSDFAFSPDGSRLAVSEPSGGNDLLIYDAKNGKELCRSTTTNSSGYDVGLFGSKMQFNSDNSKIFCGGYTLFDISGPTATVIKSFGNKDNYDLKLYDDGTKLVGHTAKGTFKIYSAADGSILNSFSNPVAAYYSCGFIRDENAVIFRYADTAIVWDLINDNEKRRFTFIDNGGGNGFSSFGTSEDGNMLEITGALFYDTKTGKNVGQIPVGEATFSQHYVCTTTILGGALVVKIIKIADGSTYTTKIFPIPSGHQVAISRDEHYIAVSSGVSGASYPYNSKIRIWKLQ
jgi:hypothetical protein